MDEATANIDIKTEELIQRAINEYLDNSTIITIAHRIKTVLSYDRIITIKNGEILEFDTPQNLINNKDSLFYELYSNSAIL
jgi:ABC-type multidrug transport system fused ATPase/permease subunit